MVRGGWRRSGFLRLVQVLLVVAGIVAMHQMGGGTHRMDMPALHPKALAAQTGMSSMEHDVDAAALPTRWALTAAAVSVGHTAVAPVGASGSAPAVCVAVLLGLFALLARARPTACGRPSGTSASGTAHSSAPLGRGPPRLLLARLCVLRT